MEFVLKNNAIKITEQDNVVIAATDIKKETPVVVSGAALFKAREDIKAGHKIALTTIGKGERVIRYGEPILVTQNMVQAGEWVHIHNAKPIPGELEK
jgi:hypothetical protein